MKHKKCVADLAQALEAHGEILAVAESCTGGLLAAALTDIPGSSAWFDCGFITYSYAAKQSMLGVPATLLNEHGAVSLTVVAAMAEGCLKYSRASISVSISGIAGPDGGTPEKPVGTVCFGFAGSNRKTESVQKQFSGDRQAVRTQSVEFAISQLVKRLSG